MKTIFIKVNHWYYDSTGCPHKSHESTIINREDMKKYCGYTNYKRLYELRYTANGVSVDETTKTISRLAVMTVAAVCFVRCCNGEDLRFRRMAKLGLSLS